MKAVEVHELKKRLSEYLRMVRRGEGILVTDRGEVVAELRPPGESKPGTGYPLLDSLARKGVVRVGAANDASLYPRLERLLTHAEVAHLLDEERGER